LSREVSMKLGIVLLPWNCYVQWTEQSKEPQVY
jgi:hypothetical protein